MTLEKFCMSYEFRRKLTHLITGTASVLLLTIDAFYNYAALIFLAGLIVSLIFSIICKYFSPKFVMSMLQLFDKPKDFKKFPGKGSVYYFAGLLISVLFFERNIASASIIILAVGDPAAHFIGRYFGKTRLIINQRKLLEGTLAGVMFGTLAALLFVPFPLAFFGGAFGMIAEAIELEYFNLDDNLFIPIVAGITMSIIQTL